MLVESKAEASQIVKESVNNNSMVVDLMAVLQASMEAVKLRTKSLKTKKRA